MEKPEPEEAYLQPQCLGFNPVGLRAYPLWLPSWAAPAFVDGPLRSSRISESQLGGKPSLCAS